MKKKVELEQLEKNYWDYAVAQMPDGTFRVRNPYQKRLPQGLVHYSAGRDGGFQRWGLPQPGAILAGSH